MPKGGTSIDLAAAPLHWMCHGCGGVGQQIGIL
jgi:hypothetical protein